MQITSVTPGLEIVDIRRSLPTNPHCPNPLQNGWYQRSWGEIQGITVHHTLSYSPWSTAAYYIAKGGGRPTLPYHYWICPCGSVMLCLDLTQGCWHDHTGHRNRNISVGMAGSLHVARPSEPQLASTALLIVHLMRNLEIYINEVRGHNDRSRPHGYPTTCPGWTCQRSGHWRKALFDWIHKHLTHHNGG